ncbi:ABC transporter permease [Meridianimaribacter flavus]|uniref:Lipoprotein-releasing system permease protein n=1 Tax=Meridianimaribacter flavus TaxID=571115 RepID=A0ABY2G9A7_9FLAO|nr:ABC transporter permease [Meridianimaribacter flavus]TDY13529.1 lipoprotein-releasing system permease protein [Meridianimaribacter flavus]
MNVSLYIAKRYLFSKSSNNAINIMTVIAASGIVIASAALFIVLSGFAGLKNFSLEFSSFVDPDLKLTPVEGKSFVFSEKDSLALADISDIKYYSKTIEERVILEFDGKRKLANIKGVDANYTRVTSIDTMVVSGSWLTDSNQIVSGWGISNTLSFGVLDYGKSLTIYVPKPGKGQISSVRGAFNSINAVNTGVFHINEDLDNEYVYSNLSTAKYLMNYNDNQISSIELKLTENANEATVRDALTAAFGNRFQIKNRNELNDSLNKMLNTENMAVYLIFTLVIIIALFNVIGALIMMILDKKESLNTLFNLGVDVSQIKNVFFLQGSLMTVLGGILGLVIGFLIVLFQYLFELVMLTPSLPYPVAIKPINFVIVLVTITVLGILASKLASSRINKALVNNF